MLVIQEQRDRLHVTGNTVSDRNASLLLLEESFRELQRGYYAEEPSTSKSWDHEIELMISTLRELQEHPARYDDFASIDARCTSRHRAH